MAVAELLVRRGRSAEAIEQLSALLAQNPQHFAARQLRGELRRQDGELTQAKSDITLATQSQPGSVESWVTLAEICLQSGDLSGAVQAANQAVRLDQRHASAWHTLGAANLALGNEDQAIKAFRRCTHLEEEPRHWIALADACRRSKREPLALEAVRYARRLRSTHYEDQLNIGHLLIHLGASAEAADHCRGLMRRFPYRWEHLRLLAEIESERAAWATSLMLLNLAVRIAPQEESLRKELSLAYAACSRPGLGEAIAKENEARDDH